jgi:hypothetical protein
MALSRKTVFRSNTFDRVSRERKAAYDRGMSKGLKRAGLFVQRESQKICPVDTGALRNSAFTRHTGQGADTVVEVGYTQNYAIFVHERYTRFLTGPFRQNMDNIRRIVRESVRGEL